VLIYRLFSHDGYGNFNLLQEFEALNDQMADRFADRWLKAGPLEMWQSARKVKCWG